MTVAELIKRLQEKPQDAVVVKPYGIRGGEYVETSDWVELIDVAQHKNERPGHWWDCKSRHYDNRDEYTIVTAVVL